MNTPRLVSIQVGLPAVHGQPAWRTGFFKSPIRGPVQLGRTNLVGENFTVTFLNEGNVCLGDVYAIGSARVEVSQPRQPCANITRRWSLPGLTERVQATGRHGWYLRVLQEGQVRAGDAVELLERPCPDWTITRAFRVMRQRRSNRAEAARLAQVPALSSAWREQLDTSR